MSNLTTIQAIYEAFGNGDLPGALAHMSEDIAWEPELPDYGLPWLQPGRGKAHVAAFFTALGTAMDFAGLEPLNWLEGGDQVAVVVRASASVRGNPLPGYEVHLWTLGADGKATALSHFVDTHGHMLASGKA